MPNKHTLKYFVFTRKHKTRYSIVYIILMQQLNGTFMVPFTVLKVCTRKYKFVSSTCSATIVYLVSKVLLGLLQTPLLP